MDSEPEISVEEILWEVLSGSEGSRSGQSTTEVQQKLYYSIVTTEDTAYSVGNSGAGTTLQSYFPIKARGLGFCVLLQAVIECGLLGGSGHKLG